MALGFFFLWLDLRFFMNYVFYGENFSEFFFEQGSIGYQLISHISSAHNFFSIAACFFCREYR